jgi:hypothetical protein
MLFLFNYPVFENCSTDFEGTCPYQLNASMDETGKWYIIVFDELYPNTYYKSWTEFIEHQVQVPSNEIASVNPVDDEAAAVLCRFLALADDSWNIVIGDLPYS